MTDLTDLTDEQLADHIGAGLREAERRAKDETSSYDEEVRGDVLAKLEEAHELLIEAETLVLNAGGVQNRSGGDKTNP